MEHQLITEPASLRVILRIAQPIVIALGYSIRIEVVYTERDQNRHTALQGCRGDGGIIEQIDIFAYTQVEHESQQ